MLYRYSEVFRSLLMLFDGVLVAACWLGAYGLRFHVGLPTPLGVPEFQSYLSLLLLIVPLWFVLYRSFGLYSPRRSGSIYAESFQLLRANALGVLALVAITFFLRSYFYSRGVIGIFALLSVSSVICVRALIRLGLQRMRRKGYNLRFVVVVGRGRLAEEVIDRIHSRPESGLKILGVFAEGHPPAGSRIRGVPVLGGYGALKPLLAERRVDQVILAMGRDEGTALEKVIRDLDDETANLIFVPDLMHIMTLNSSVDEIDGMPVISLRQTPLVGWAAVRKRSLDLAIAIPAFLISLPLQLAIAAAIGLSQGRPIFYRQERMGLDGRLFQIVKFRTMRRDAESTSGPVWATAGDPRQTRLGRWLRRLSLDELPQLWLVLRGQMSLVGPRPERPIFIEVFRREVPGYMLRHRIKAGMTGWAQVHGLRGDTSVHERVEHDLYYIQNWSISLDLRIVLKTIRHLLFERRGS